MAQPPSARSISQWLSELASSDAPTRDAARFHLTQLDRRELPELRRAINQARPLAPSQKAALPGIVQEVFLSGEPYREKEPAQGFLGIIMDLTALEIRDLPGRPQSTGSPGVVVADRIPGFCAARRLRDGDVILGSSNAPHLFRGAADLKQAIGGLPPGTTLTLLVLRDGQIIHVPLTLDAYPLDIDLDQAQEFRTHRAQEFATFWQHHFAPLLPPNPAGGAEVNAGK